MRAIGREADARGEIQKGVLWCRVQRLLRDIAQDKVGVIAGGCHAGIGISWRHEIAFAAHLRQQQQASRVRRGPKVP